MKRLTDSTGSAFKELVPAALRASGMTQDALVLQHKLSAWTFRRQFASNKSNIADKDHKREEKPHDRARGLGEQETNDRPPHRRSIRAVGALPQ